MAATPPARTATARASQAAASMAAELQAMISAVTRSGMSSAKVIPTMPPSEMPQTAARLTPAASKTAAASLANMASV